MKKQKLVQMYNRSHFLPTSSKSISTSTTLRQRSPSIQLYESQSPREQSILKGNNFLDNNIEHLTTLKDLISNEDNIVSGHKEWCTNVCCKIDNMFSTIHSHVENVLTGERVKMKKSVESQYCQFLQFMKDVKVQIKAFYNNKEQLQSEKVLSLTRKFEQENSEYYSSKKIEIRNPFDQQNRQREKFKQLNNFYTSNQDMLQQLSEKAQQHLRFRQKLKDKTDQFEYILDKFRETIDYSVMKMVECCNSFLQNDFIKQ